MLVFPSHPPPIYLIWIFIDFFSCVLVEALRFFLAIMWPLSMRYRDSVVALWGLSWSAACGLLVPLTGMNPFPCIVRQILKHRTTREIPHFSASISFSVRLPLFSTSTLDPCSKLILPGRDLPAPHPPPHTLSTSQPLTGSIYRWINWHTMKEKQKPAIANNTD